jgi:predicted HNH restriction endonuclease
MGILKFPKPEGKDKEKIKENLREYRREQAMLAIMRDNAWCIRCFWVFDRTREFEHIHHVRGRGTHAGHPREHYTNLMCVCAECHQQLEPVYVEENNPDQMFLQRQMNEHPLNREFVPPERS